MEQVLQNSASMVLHTLLFYFIFSVLTNAIDSSEFFVTCFLWSKCIFSFVYGLSIDIPADGEFVSFSVALIRSSRQQTDLVADVPHKNLREK